MHKYNLKHALYKQGWKDLQVLTLSPEEEKVQLKDGVVYTSSLCPECAGKICIAWGEIFCPVCGFTPNR